MIEIVFSDSACGSLKMAKSVGKGECITGCVGAIISMHDGSAPVAEEIAEAQKQAEIKHRLEWEKAVPMRGSAEDVFGFNLMLSIGDISDDNFIEKRAQVIEKLWSVYPSFPDDEPFDMLENIRNGMENLLQRITPDDEIRIWYSNNPDELCGLYWFMAELAKFAKQPKAVYVVKLPEYQCKGDNTIVTYLSWSEISLSDWNRYVDYTEKATAEFCEYCVQIWQVLKHENTQLRAMINGKMHSVHEDIYDAFILREIAEQKDEFLEVMLIGKILAKYQLGISDALLAHRIEHIIDSGSLKAVSEPTQGMPTYHRKLRKIK